MKIAQLERLLTDLHNTLTELFDIQERKRTALAAMSTEELQRLSQIEGKLVERMTEASKRRAEFLATATDGRQPARSLRELVKRLPDDVRPEFQEKLAGIRRFAQRVRREASANWLATYRTNAHVRELLELIAQASQASSAETDGGAGLFLDSTA